MQTSVTKFTCWSPIRSILPVVRPIIQNRQSVRVSGLLLTILQLSRTEDYSVKPISSFRFLKMTWLDKPVADRAIYKLIKQREVSSIIEIGLGDGTRCEKLIAVAQKFSEEKVRYTGVDLFDARESSTPLKLIEMHRRLKGIEAKTQLVPGDMGSALPRIANSHLRTDLILISAGFEREQFSEVKSFLPRMLHASSVVMVQTKEDGEFKKLTRLEIEKAIGSPQVDRKAA